MKNNNSDRLISDKISSMDTLSGGIVYGREEAWEKLQARMEQKPAKKITFWYRLAAAAVLLLVVCSTVVLYHPQKEVAVNKEAKKVMEQSGTAAAVNPVLPVAEQAHEKIITGKSPVMKMYSGKRNRNMPKEPIQEMQTAVIDVQPAPVLVDENKTEAIAANNTSSPIPVAASMKVVHINDLENRAGMENRMPLGNNVTAVNFSQMRVVYINDVEKEDKEVNSILRENRLTLGHFPFSRPVYYNDNSDQEEYHRPLNFLKSKFNSQN